MKKSLLMLLTIPMIITLAGCGDKTSGGPTGPSNSLTITTSAPGGDGGGTTTPTAPGEVIPADVVTFHYQNGEEDFSNYAFWVWGSNRSGIEFSATGTDEFGAYLTLNPKTDIGVNYVQKGIYFLVKSKGTWDFQTADMYIPYVKYPPKKVGDKYVLDIYIIPNANKSKLLIFSSLDESSREKVTYSYFKEDCKTIQVDADGKMRKLYLYKLPYAYFQQDMLTGDAEISPYLVGTKELDKDGQTSATFEIEGDLALNECYRIGAEFVADSSYVSYFDVLLDRVYKTDAFNRYSYTGNDLGVTFEKDDGKIKSTTFKVWAPTSYLAKVNIYRYGNDASYYKDLSSAAKSIYDNPTFSKVMTLDPETGVYSATLGDFEGFYYTYTFVNALGENETIDPYAKSAGIDGKRGLIIDFENQKARDEEFDKLPLVWDGTEYDIESSLDLCISENHIRDLTMDDTWSSNPDDDSLRGTYEGFIKKGTKYEKGSESVTTGFDHLEELGVNAIQILPFYDQDNMEEKDERIFNWGYNPQNYNVIEGSYSSDPFDGYVRVREFKKLVAAFANNANKARIIMDVVYNHVSSPQTNPLNYVVPNYYFRLDELGGFTDGSGCGNEIRSEAPMARKFIVDSVVHWASTYKIKGFRFDLMGLIDVETMRGVKEALYAIDPDIVVYGEGWTGDMSWNTDHAVVDSAYSKLYHSETSPGMVGAFNDCGRNALKGGNGSGKPKYPEYGFISQGAEHLSRDTVNKLADMMKGNYTGKGGNPEQTINYASCHDNFTLFDQLNYTLSDDGGVTEPNIETVAQASVAVNASVILSNGVSFIHGGEEIFRTKVLTDEDEADVKDETTMFGKRISHNSYMYSDECNSYKYDRKLDLVEYFNMYKWLVNFRKELKTLAYPDNNFDTDSINTWGTEEGTRLATFRVGKDGTKYYFFLNGRSNDTYIPSGEHESLIFNNSSANVTFSNYNYHMTDKYQFVIYQGDI